MILFELHKIFVINAYMKSRDMICIFDATPLLVANCPSFVNPGEISQSAVSGIRFLFLINFEITPSFAHLQIYHVRSSGTSRWKIGYCCFQSGRENQQIGSFG